MADQYSDRERAAAMAMLAEWPLVPETMEDAMRLARVALRAADVVGEESEEKYDPLTGKKLLPEQIRLIHKVILGGER